MAQLKQREHWQMHDQRWRERQRPPAGQMWMCIPLPDEPLDGHGHPLEYRDCKHCGRGFWIRVRASSQSCGRIRCDLARDREERAFMSTDEMFEYRKASREYFTARDEEEARLAGRAPGSAAKGGLKTLGVR